jgi:hypothetical protein
VLAACASSVELDLSLIGESQDRSAHGHIVTVHDTQSHRIITERGAEFDGDDDFISVTGMTEYASDARFSISFWMSKEACTEEDYEYLYSHQEIASADAMRNIDNSNVNIYLACESAGSGWSTHGGSVTRFLLRDDSGSGQFARFDYPLHEAGSFDDITNRWVHIVLSVSPGQIQIFADGQAVSDTDDIHYYVEDVGQANDIAYPDPGALTSQLTGFRLTDALYLGSRSDGAADRHFVGSLAGVVVGSDQFALADASCLFQEGEEFLWYSTAACSDVSMATFVNGELALSMLDGQDPPQDTSGHHHAVQNNGHVGMSTSGASFDGTGSYLTVDTFEYASDAVFSISLWVHKQQCGGATYEYLYSHYETTGSLWEQSSYALMMFLCEQTGASDSTADGSVLRYEIKDTSGNRGVFDYSVHDAGDFDAITQGWIHVIWTVSAASMSTFVDGAAVDAGRYGFYQGLPPADNVARPRPDQLSPALAGLNLLSAVYLGGRFDEHRQRVFTGRMALVSVYDRVIGSDEAACLFHDGSDEGLPVDPGATGRRVLAKDIQDWRPA